MDGFLRIFVKKVKYRGEKNKKKSKKCSYGYFLTNESLNFYLFPLAIRR